MEQRFGLNHDVNLTCSFAAMRIDLSESKGPADVLLDHIADKRVTVVA